MDKILEYLAPKTFHRVAYVVVVLWILISVAFSIIIDKMENDEAKFHFRCSGAKSKNDDTVRGKCYEKYLKQNNKFGLPVYGFVIINLILTVIVCAVYSQIVKHKVDHLSRGIRIDDQEKRLLHQETVSSTGKTLFIAYCVQLSIRLVLGVTFIIIQIQLLYPLKFSSKFDCYLADRITQPRNSSKNAQNSTLHDCHNKRAETRTFWMYAVLAANGFHVTGLLVETFYLVLRACIKRSFMQDSKFLKTHLSLIQHQNRKFQEFIESAKRIINKQTLSLLELQSPLLRDPGDDTTAETLSLAQIYTNLAVIQNRQTYEFTDNREEQLKVYSGSHDQDLQLESLSNLLNVESKKVLIVGRPGIGKTLSCLKLLRDWASGTKIPFEAAFFVRFRTFNSAKDLSLRELLIKSEYFPTRHMDDRTWNHLLKNPKGVLILFDGFDEFKHGKNMAVAATHPRGTDEKKPLQILYQWLVRGELLEDASIVTTTRPTALSAIAHLKFDKTYEIVGFSTKQIKMYINKFARGNKQEGEKLWRHIDSNMNLRSLCYIPMNSFIICTSLSEIMQIESSDSVTLPSRLTKIYKIAVKVFYFKHTKEFRGKHLARKKILSDDLPSEVKENLGRVAFEGIKEGKLILEGNEVRGMENSALFHRLPDPKNVALEDEEQFCFIHLTMQEFFAATYMVKNMNKSALRRFVSENIKNSCKWQLVFQFLAGLMENENHLPIEIITDLLPVKTEKYEIADSNEQWTDNEKKRMVICWPTKEEKDIAVTLIKCINENSSMNQEAQRKLKKINFNCVNFMAGRLTAVDCSSLVNVINFQKISHLDLGTNNIGPLGCFEICKLLKRTKSQLSWLNLKNNKLTEEAANYLAEAIEDINCKLHTLYLSRNKISATGTQHLAKAINNNNNCLLHTLDLSENNISDIGAQHLVQAINNNCQLRTLHLRENNISDMGAKHFAEAINNNNCQLCTLNLTANNISDRGAEHLAEAINNNNCHLHTLDLSKNKISEIGAQSLAEAMKDNNCQLRTLYLRENNISDMGAKHFAEAINNNNCQLCTLNLTANNISDRGAEHLAEAINNNNCHLHTLDLSKNKISEIGAQSLAEAMKDNNCQLRTLYLRENNISDMGAKHFAEAINNNNCQLCTLNLTANNISDRGAEHLAEAINNNNCHLHTLDLSKNNISDIGAQHFAKAMNTNQPITLILTNNKITDIGLQYLAKALNTNNSQQRTFRPHSK